MDTDAARAMAIWVASPFVWLLIVYTVIMAVKLPIVGVTWAVKRTAGLLRGASDDE